MDKDNFALVKENESQFRDVSTYYVVGKTGRHDWKMIQECVGEMVFGKGGHVHLIFKGKCE